MNTTTTPMALNGQRISFDGLNCYVAGEGPPLLLVHSVNATASAAEVRPLYEHYSRQRTVFALDLPGFGLSERGNRAYDPRLMTDALHATVTQIRRRCGGRPVDALALSLGCEFLARAAWEAPAHFGRLAFVSPTGLQGHKPLRHAIGSTREVPGLLAVLRQPMWAQALYRNLTRPAVVRYFLERTFGSQQIDEDLWAHAVLSAQQPGARHAPLSFLARRLCSADIHTVYEGLKQPVWLSHGTRGAFTDFRALQMLPALATWRKTAFHGGALPHFEALGAFAHAFDSFLAGRGSAQLAHLVRKPAFGAAATTLAGLPVQRKPKTDSA